MELSGKIIAVLPEKSGMSQRTGSEWKVQEYVLETADQYPRKMCFSIFGSDKIEQFAIHEGETLTVSFDIDAHDYQGRWFNSIRAWKVDRNPVAPPQPVGSAAGGSEGPVAPFPPTSAAAPASNVGESGADDLPF